MKVMALGILAAGILRFKIRLSERSVLDLCYFLHETIHVQKTVKNTYEDLQNFPTGIPYLYLYLVYIVGKKREKKNLHDK